MDFDVLLNGIWDSLDKYRGSERADFKKAMRSRLETEEMYVAESDQELRELALEHTDLEEPE